MQFLLKYLGLILLSLAIFSCARQDNPTPQALNSLDSPKEVRLYGVSSVGNRDSLMVKVTFQRMADGKPSEAIYREYSPLSYQYTKYEFTYDASGNLALKKIYRSFFGTNWSPDMEFKYTYNSIGNIVQEESRVTATDRSPIRVVRTYSYFPGNKYQVENLETQSGYTQRTLSQYYQDASGNDTLVYQSIDSAGVPVLRPYETRTFDANSRLVKVSYPANSPLGSTRELFENYLSCKIPKSWSYVSGSLSGYYPYGYKLYFGPFYPFVNANYIPSKHTLVSHGRVAAELDNSNGAAVEVNSAGFIKTIRYQNPANQFFNFKYRMEFDYE